MQCDNCGTEFKTAIPRKNYPSCPDCGERVKPTLNYKSPVKDEDEANE